MVEGKGGDTDRHAARSYAGYVSSGSPPIFISIPIPTKSALFLTILNDDYYPWSAIIIFLSCYFPQNHIIIVLIIAWMYHVGSTFLFRFSSLQCLFITIYKVLYNSACTNHNELIRDGHSEKLHMTRNMFFERFYLL